MGPGWDRCRCYRHSGKEPFYWLAGFWKERVIVPAPGRRSWGDGGFRFRHPVLDDLPVLSFFQSR
jgi:hypothetical protein